MDLHPQESLKIIPIEQMNLLVIRKKNKLLTLQKSFWIWVEKEQTSRKTERTSMISGMPAMGRAY